MKGPFDCLQGAGSGRVQILTLGKMSSAPRLQSPQRPCNDDVPQVLRCGAVGLPETGGGFLLDAVM